LPRRAFLPYPPARRTPNFRPSEKEPRQSKSFSSRKNSFALHRSHCVPPPVCTHAEPSRKIAFTFFDFAHARFLILKGKGNFSARQAAALRWLAADQRRFRFLDLCIKFGKIISKV